MLTKVYNEPRIFQIDVPLPDNPLRNLNCYVVQDGGETLIIDTGFNRPECREALLEGLAHRALSALCEKVFAETELERLSLRVYCFNLPAIRCYERLGFLVTEYFEEADSHWNNYAMERKK